MQYAIWIYGINDDTLKVVGTDFHATQRKVGNEELESWLLTRLNPHIDFEIIDDFDYEDKGHVCVFKIPAATNQPVSFLHEEYVRVASTTRKLRDFPQKEAKIWRGGQKSVKKMIVKEKLTAMQVVSLLSAETYFDMMKLPFPTDTMGIIDRMIAEKIVTQDEVWYSITELGALLFAKHLSDFDDLRRKMVWVIVYK